jgi:DNA (cytosine-5)-methyltransferase 1
MSEPTEVLDLFAGPGGWDVGALGLGLEPLGIEYDDAACETRRAAGLRTEQADIAALEPSDYGPVDGLIASPPCQAWSMAGKGAGRTHDQAAVFARASAYAHGRRPDEVEWEDPRSSLAAEPMRWAAALKPRWMAWEQVPPVVELWQQSAVWLREMGYSVWTGILSAERYGVPQTRRRAILIARRDGVHAQPPQPTHQAFKAGEPQWEHPQISLEGELLPWISMAEALGWTSGLIAHETGNTKGGTRDGLERPADDPSRTIDSRADQIRVGFPRLADDGAATEDGYRERDFRSADEPAFNLTEKARSWTVNTGRDWKKGGTRDDAQEFDATEQPAPTIDGKGRWHYRNGNQERAAIRAEDEPAPTLHFGHALNSGVEWTRTPDEPWRPREIPEIAEKPAPTITGSRRSDQGGIVGRQLKPGEGRNVGGRDWTDGRPATTLTGDPRIARPGHHGSGDERDQAARQMVDAVRVTEQQAAVLQGFPPNYPWRGSRTKRFEQIGNAVPPPLAAAILEAAAR